MSVYLNLGVRKGYTGPCGSLMHSEDQQPHRRLRYPESRESRQTCISEWTWPPGERGGPPTNVHTKYAPSASAVHALLDVTTEGLKVSHLHKVGQRALSRGWTTSGSNFRKTMHRR